PLGIARHAKRFGQHGGACVAPPVPILPLSSELQRRSKLLALYYRRGDLSLALIRCAIAAQPIPFEQRVSFERIFASVCIQISSNFKNSSNETAPSWPIAKALPSPPSISPFEAPGVLHQGDRAI